MSCDKFCHNTSMHCPTYRYVMCACVCMLSCIFTYICDTFMWSPEGDIGPLACLLRQGLSLNLELTSPGSYPSQHALGLLCAASGVLRFQVIITPVQLFLHVCWESRLRSSSFLSKHFIHRAISSDLYNLISMFGFQFYSFIFF